VEDATKIQVDLGSTQTLKWIKRLIIDKGLLRRTEIVQNEIEALVQCNVS
jgi:hypothetical protein